MGKRVLVLGATGFTGLSVVNGLLDAGYRVLALSRTAYRLPVRDGLIPIAQPLENTDAYRPELASCDAVFHLASDSTPGSTANQPTLDASLNLLPTLRLLEAMQTFPNTPLIFLSSGGATYAPSHTEVLSESAPVAPVSNYGAGKLAIEQFIGAHVRKHRARAVAVRGANFYGAGQPYRTGFGVVPTIFRRMRDGLQMTIWGDGGHVRDYLYIDDLVALCILLIDATPAQGDFRILNAGTGVGTSINALCNACERTTGIALNRNYTGERGVDPGRIVLSSQLANSLTGWSPKVALDEGLARTWEWFRLNDH